MTFAILATKRDAGRADDLRSQGLVPGVLYGPDIAPAAISFPAGVFQKLHAEAGQSSLIDVTIEGAAPVPALIQDIQYDPVSEAIIHVDFRQINLKKTMHATVALQFAGESSAVKELGGTLVKALGELHVTCLPQDLVGHITVSIASLKTFDDIIRVSDLSIPAGITVTDDAQMTVAKVLPPFTEEQLKAMEEQGPKSLEDIELAKKEKKETDEEGEEGAPEGEKPEASGKEEKKPEKPAKGGKE